MKKEYETPSFQYYEVYLSENVLDISEGEGVGDGGVIVDPGTGDGWDDW